MSSFLADRGWTGRHDFVPQATAKPDALHHPSLLSWAEKVSEISIKIRFLWKIYLISLLATDSFLELSPPTPRNSMESIGKKEREEGERNEGGRRKEGSRKKKGDEPLQEQILDPPLLELEHYKSGNYEDKALAIGAWTPGQLGDRPSNVLGLAWHHGPHVVSRHILTTCICVAWLLIGFLLWVCLDLKLLQIFQTFHHIEITSKH